MRNTSLRISENHIHWHSGPLRNHLRERVSVWYDDERRAINIPREIYSLLRSYSNTSTVHCWPANILQQGPLHTNVRLILGVFLLKIKTSKNIQHFTAYWEDKVIQSVQMSPYGHKTTPNEGTVLFHSYISAHMTASLLDSGPVC